jgi:hypothetical protein
MMARAELAVAGHLDIGEMDEADRRADRCRAGVPPPDAGRGVRDLAVRASGLSEPTLAAVRALIDHFRVKDLPAVVGAAAEDPASNSG